MGGGWLGVRFWKEVGASGMSSSQAGKLLRITNPKGGKSREISMEQHVGSCAKKKSAPVNKARVSKPRAGLDLELEVAVCAECGELETGWYDGDLISL